MALFNCPECGAQISDKAAACPKCGVTINPAPAVTNAPLRRTPRISDRTAIGIIAAMAAVMYGLTMIPWFITLDDFQHYINITASYWGIAATGLSLAATGFAFTKQWLVSTATTVAGMGAATAACFDFTSSIIIDAPATDIPDHKIIYAYMTIFLIAGAIATVIGAIKSADRHPDESEASASGSWTQLAGIAMCAILLASYYTTWSKFTINETSLPIMGQEYILSNPTTICIWIAIFGISTGRWIATAIAAGINMIYGIYTLTTDGFSGTYRGFYDYDYEETTFAGGIYFMIFIAALLLVLSIIAERRQREQAAKA